MTPSERMNVTNSPLFSGAPSEVVELILQCSQVRAFNRGETLFLQGRKASVIYIILSGWVKLYRAIQNETVVVVDVLTVGGSFGEAAALSGNVSPFGAEAVTNVRVICIEAEIYRRQICENPNFAVSVLSTTFLQLQSLITHVESLKSQTAAQRLADFLLDLTDSVSGEGEVVLPYDKVLLAARLGIKPATLSRAFFRLRDYGVVTRQNHIVISDIAILRDFVAEDLGYY